MTQIVEAIYQNGLFRLTRPQEIPLREGQNVRLTVESEDDSSDVLALAADVYRGLSDAEIDEVEAIAREGNKFFDDRT